MLFRIKIAPKLHLIGLNCWDCRHFDRMLEMWFFLSHTAGGVEAITNIVGAEFPSSCYATDALQSLELNFANKTLTILYCINFHFHYVSIVVYLNAFKYFNDGKTLFTNCKSHTLNAAFFVISICFNLIWFLCCHSKTRPRVNVEKPLDEASCSSNMTFTRACQTFIQGFSNLIAFEIPLT